MSVRKIAGDYADARNIHGRRAALTVVAKMYGIAPANVQSALDEVAELLKSSEQFRQSLTSSTPESKAAFHQKMLDTRTRLRLPNKETNE